MMRAISLMFLLFHFMSSEDQAVFKDKNADKHIADTTHGNTFFLAEAVRFELTNGCPLPVFKTGAIDHSATPPEHAPGAHLPTCTKRAVYRRLAPHRTGGMGVRPHPHVH